MRHAHFHKVFGCCYLEIEDLSLVFTDQRMTKLMLLTSTPQLARTPDNTFTSAVHRVGIQIQFYLNLLSSPSFPLHFPLTSFGQSSISIF